MLARLFISLAYSGTQSVGVVPNPIAGHPVFELRAGADRIDSLNHPFLCGEGTPLPWLSFEACGNGAGLLHNDDGLDFAHFRTKARILGASSGRKTLDWQGGIGIAEIQNTTDAAGFKFGRARPSPTGEAPVEAAGPELSMSLKGRYFADPGARAYLSADLNAGAALIEGAKAVTGSGPLVPFAAFTIGLGF